MAYPNNPLFDLLRALDPQQATANANAEQTTTPEAQTGATEAHEQFPPHPFAAFSPFFAFPPHPYPHPHHGGGRRGGPGRGGRGGPRGPLDGEAEPQGPHGGRHHGHGRRGGPRSECPAMNPEARGSDSESEPQGPHGGRHHGHGRHGYGHGRGGWHGGREPPAYAAFGGAPFDISAFVNSLASHPLAEALRNVVDEAARAGGAAADPNTAPGEARGADENEAFAPAVDTFSTSTEYVLHVALPGAKKEDVGVNWDAEKGELNLAGVVYRAGDEEFISTLKTGERRVGVFERSVKLPLEGDEKVEVDGDEISAKLEDGVLVVRVGKVVREEAWTDLKRVEVL